MSCSTTSQFDCFCSCVRKSVLHASRVQRERTHLFSRCVRQLVCLHLVTKLLLLLVHDSTKHGCKASIMQQQSSQGKLFFFFFLQSASGQTSPIFLSLHEATTTTTTAYERTESRHYMVVSVCGRISLTCQTCKARAARFNVK